MIFDERLYDIIDQNGRVSYSALSTLVRRTNIDLFKRFSPRPFLVGKELYDGMLTKEKFDRTKTVPISKRFVIDDTASFKRSEQLISRSEAISKAIFALNKKPFSEEKANIITIGRAGGNDLVIVDYSISRRHANIEIYFDKYFIVDNGSTNGTRIGGCELKAGEKKMLEIGSIVSFGRLAFMLMNTEQLYDMLENGN